MSQDSWRQHRLVFWILGLPPTLWLTAFFLIPLALIWAFSFGEKVGITGIEISGTLENYERTIEPIYLQIFAKSLIFRADSCHPGPVEGVGK